MNYKIYIDHSGLSNSAKKIEEYIASIDSYMASMNDEVDEMNAFWVGDDYVAFKEKWSQNNSFASATSNFKNALQEYANHLNEVSNIYRNAQISAINEASNLPNWF